MIFKFYKENSFWFIDLPSYTGPKEDLQMVLGADKMLDLISDFYYSNETSVTLKVDLKPFENSQELILIEETPQTGGGSYSIEKIGNIIMKDFGIEKIWLCDVVKFIFGHMPENFYISFE